MPRHLPQLPLEIIMDILSRLPVKPLLQFKCVCKSWRSLISHNPEFAKLHLQRTKQDLNYLNHHRLLLSTCPFQSLDMEAYCDADDNLVTRKHRFPVKDPEDDDFEFVGSCNGLISAVSESDNQIIVWNPTTEESRQLPKPVSFANGKVFYGFGYDSHLDDYKVVRTARFSTNNEVKMEIFNLKGNTWRTVQDLNCSARIQGSATAVNGVLHWLVCENMIQSFDLVEEKFLEMTTVPDYAIENLDMELKVLGDGLCVCSSCYAEHFEAWTMQGYGTKACWAKLFSFSSDHVPACEFSLNVLWVTNNGNIMLDLDSTEIVIYNPIEQTSKQYVPNDWDWFLATTYTESLVSPNAGNAYVAADDGGQN